MSAIKIISHQSPDTDAACSAIVYAWYQKNYLQTDAQAYIYGSINREAEFVLQKFGIDMPPQITAVTSEDKLIITDTSNPEELVPSLYEAAILEVVDHHKLGGLKTANPIRVTIWPYASCCSVMWKLFKYENHTEIPAKIAGLMVSAILSDTLKFTSPTTTEFDKQAAQDLAQIAGVEIDQLADEMFSAKSDLTGMTNKDILLSDSKIFKMNDKKVRISVLETTKPDNALKMLDSLKETMVELKQEEQLDYIFFFIVDIIKTEGITVTTNEAEVKIAEKAFNKEFTSGLQYLPGVVSRKKQMVPGIETALT